MKSAKDYYPRSKRTTKQEEENYILYIVFLKLVPKDFPRETPESVQFARVERRNSEK